MKTKYKNFIVEVDHDVVWGYNWTITKPTGMMLTSDDVVPTVISSSWTTERDAFKSACDLIDLMLENEIVVKPITDESYIGKKHDLSADEIGLIKPSNGNLKADKGEHDPGNKEHPGHA